MTGLDLGPSSLPSLEAERPDSLFGVQGVPLSFRQRFGAAESSPLLGVCKPRPGSYSLFEYLGHAMSRALPHNRGGRVRGLETPEI